MFLIKHFPPLNFRYNHCSYAEDYHKELTESVCREKAKMKGFH